MSTQSSKNYVGLYDDQFAGMTPTGNIIRDAWVFGILPEDQDCAGWSLGQIQDLYDRVHAAWEPYGHLVSRLPPELRERHERIYEEAVRLARQRGWDPGVEDEEY